MEFKLKINEVERTIFAEKTEKTIDGDDYPSIKMWFFHDNGVEQSVEFAYKTNSLRNEEWSGLNIDEAVLWVSRYLTTAGDTVSKLDEATL